MQVLKNPTDPSGTMYLKPTGAPKGLLIERDISAALGKLHIVRGPLVPASLVGLAALYTHAIDAVVSILGCASPFYLPSLVGAVAMGSEPLSSAENLPGGLYRLDRVSS